MLSGGLTLCSVGVDTTAISIVSDMAIIGFTLLKTLGIYRVHQQTESLRVSVTHKLVRNGKCYETY